MPVYPQSFIEDLKAQADIVTVAQDYVSLRRAGSSYKGLCPFHSEKTPSFTVNREKGFFHCFGCGAGGDVFKFVELQEGLGFQDAVKHLASRFGLPLPALADDGTSKLDAAERESLLKVHELATAFFRQQLQESGGARARRQLEERGLSGETIERLGVGYAPARGEDLKTHLTGAGFPVALLARAGLLVQRDDGRTLDRFRGRLVFPISRESGAVVAFGCRALDPDQQPKYLNSPETPIYSKSRVLYGLNITKSEMRRLGYAIIVEGYFDFAQVVQAGVTPVVASCGTALTPSQAHLLRRFATSAVLSFDPDAAGQGAAARSCELLVTQGFKVNVAILPGGLDPDSFVKANGARAYQELIRASQPYLDYLLDRTAARHDLRSDTGRRSFLGDMLQVAARLPDATARDQFADRLAMKARITEEVVRAEIRKAAVERRTTVTTREVPNLGKLTQAEKGLIWALVHDAAAALDALGELDEPDLQDLPSQSVLRAGLVLAQSPVASVPSLLLERLSTGEAQLVAAIAAEAAAPASPAECVRALKRLHCERERAAVQREIDRLQDLGADQNDQQIDQLWQRKRDLMEQIEALRA
ncbi:MAG: DNA primase [Acidobacteria bacterium]|nr:DNA primase [Acidobacteriota bacterium]